jgi:magnesium-protoporphyrin O-methyltransferase
VDFHVGDMLDPALGRFDCIVAMDSLIHYQAADVVRVVTELAARTRDSILFTFAPKTPALTLMHSVGKLFPRGDRAPAIEPVGYARLESLIGREPGLATWQTGRTERIASGFYTSQALELSDSRAQWAQMRA